MKQVSFFDLEHTCKNKATRKERFLAERDKVILWQVMLKALTPR